MKNYEVSFNAVGVWETLDETMCVPANNAQEAMELIIDYMIDIDINAYSGGPIDLNAPDYIYNDKNEVDRDQIEQHYRSYGWKAQEIIYTDNGEQKEDDFGVPIYGEPEYL